jgi:hypothetical protein
MGGKSIKPLARGVALIVVLTGLSVAGACGSDTTAKKDEDSGKAATEDGSTASTAAAGERGSRMIPQPVLRGDLPTAPKSARVDLGMPIF